MRVLFVVGAYSEFGTVFELAEIVHSRDDHAVFLFFKDGCRYLEDSKLLKSLGFAEAIYFLKGCCDVHETAVVRPIDYEGWVRLLEDCDKVVSWT